MDSPSAITPTTADADVERRLLRLRRYNIVMGAFHAAQGVAVLLLANGFALPVTASFLQDRPGAAAPELRTLFEIRLAWGVAAFVFLSALAHWLIASPGIYAWYRKNLLRHRNYARWIEYALSSSVMVVLIALLAGISDVAALGAIFGVNAAMILFGLLMEHYESPGRPRWLSFGFGCLTGAVPWALIAVYLWSPGVAAEPPAFVYGIFFSLFAFFNVFAVNMVLQYKQVGRWRDYLYGETAYVLLSLTAKSLLAWQVFAGTLAS
ncbi:MAG: heliorhodopsin HeR [Actinomycetota bacterium]